SLVPVVDQPDTALLAIIFAGSMLGFLPWNFHPAKIFLGEAGSTLAGFLIGTLAVISGGKIATALLVMGIPILDVLWVILRRLTTSASVFKADRKHLHFRLLDLGLSHRQTVMFLYFISAAFGVSGIFLQSAGKLIALFILVSVMILLGAFLVSAYNRKLRVRSEKVFIRNRKGQRVAVVIELPSKPRGLGFIMHGLSAFKEQPTVRAIAKAFVKNQLTAVTFDTTNTLGESDGNFELATATGYYEDLEDVIAWAASQPWYREPFFLAGSSLGGLCSLLFAEKYPQKVKGLVPVAPVVTGQWIMAGIAKEQLESWKKSGWLVEPSHSRPGVIKRLSWNYMVDLQKYDALKEVSNLSMPLLLIACGKDAVVKDESLKLLFEQLPCKKEFRIIEGAPHSIRDPEHLEILEGLVSEWIAR
ncbi:MAG: alpha/beta fold hydrolase, partial [Candidatus Margulisiibacteriota bacterium]